MSYIEHSNGLQVKCETTGCARIQQTVDGKSMNLDFTDIENVLRRYDSEGQEFLQVNFLDDRKILLTDRLIGFRPASQFGLDKSRLPKVVTTPDLISVVEAIEDSIHGGDCEKEEVLVLCKLFHSVLEGGESIGFDLSAEKIWLQRINHSGHKASA